MDATEQMVRLRLSQKTNKEFLEYASRHPEIKEKLDRAIQEYKNGFIDSITSIIPLESEELERFKGSFGPYMDKISEMFSYEKMIENRGRAYFESYDAFREKFERLYDELKNNKEVASIVNLLTIRDAVNELLYHPSFIDTLIARLAEKARKTTIDQALTDDSLYAATREIFPTEQSYREYFESSYNRETNIESVG